MRYRDLHDSNTEMYIHKLGCEIHNFFMFCPTHLTSHSKSLIPSSLHDGLQFAIDSCLDLSFHNRFTLFKQMPNLDPFHCRPRPYGPGRLILEIYDKQSKEKKYTIVY